MGYGTRALQALNAYYSGEYFNLDESAKLEVSYPDAAAIDDVSIGSSFNTSHRSSLFNQSTTLLTDHPTIRSATAIPPLLRRLTERKPGNLDYLGVSYGLTSQLLRFALSPSLPRRSRLIFAGSGSMRATCHYISVRLRAD